MAKKRKKRLKKMFEKMKKPKVKKLKGRSKFDVMRREKKLGFVK